LELHEEVNLPSGVIVQQDFGWESTSSDDEYDCDAEVRDDYLSLALLCGWDLDLGGECDEKAEDNNEPLIQKE